MCCVVCVLYICWAPIDGINTETATATIVHNMQYNIDESEPLTHKQSESLLSELCCQWWCTIGFMFSYSQFQFNQSHSIYKHNKCVLVFHSLLIPYEIGELIICKYIEFSFKMNSFSTNFDDDRQFENKNYSFHKLYASACKCMAMSVAYEIVVWSVVVQKLWFQATE